MAKAKYTSEPFKIEKGIKISDSLRGKKSNGFYVAMAREMKPDDSVLIKEKQCARSFAITLKRMYGKGAYVLRKLESGYRIWRVK